MWQHTNNQLTRTFRFANFAEAFSFMTRVAFIAEAHGHHPDWRNVWNTVHISLSTHDAGNVVTAKDYALAKAIDAVFDKQ